MVQPLGGFGIFEQHEFERRLIDGEVRVAGLPLVDFSAEHLRIEFDRLIEILDVEGELQTHVVLLVEWVLLLRALQDFFFLDLLLPAESSQSAIPVQQFSVR